MNTPELANHLGQNARTLLQTWREQFAVFRDYSPLSIGIDKQLLKRHPELDRKALRIALSMHTRSSRYLKSMEKATHRLDLDGQPDGEIDETHRVHAKEVLRERFKKDAERRKAVREAETAERQRSEKLKLLVEKFDKLR